MFGHLNAIRGTHIKGGSRELTLKLSSDLYMCWHAPLSPTRHTPSNEIIKWYRSAFEASLCWGTSSGFVWLNSANLSQKTG